MIKKSPLLISLLSLMFLLSGCSALQTAGEDPDIARSGRKQRAEGIPINIFGNDNKGARERVASSDPQYQEYLEWKEWQEFQEYKKWKEGQGETVQPE